MDEEELIILHCESINYAPSTGLTEQHDCNRAHVNGPEIALVAFKWF